MRVRAWRWRGKARVGAVRGYRWRGMENEAKDGAKAADGVKAGGWCEECVGWERRRRMV